MNKLRILPLAFLLWPAFASAICSPAQTCVVTSGTAVATGDSSIPFNFAGTGFSASGLITDYGAGNPPWLLAYLTPGEVYETWIGGSIPNEMLGQFDLTVNGVPWGLPGGGNPDARVFFDTPVINFSHEGTISAPFTFDGFFTGTPAPFPPGLGCDVLNCETLNFRGGGIVTFDLVDSGTPGTFVLLQETFTFAPEPATLSLFALGLVGLAMRRKAVAALRMS